MIALILVCSILLSWIIDLSLWQAIVVNLFLIATWITGRKMENGFWREEI